ncbi:2-phosphosulfolactate phosphatase [Paenibacillus campi]|uniref:2-phosphosulfolactate phosphatase n=1 Tax=Paenibacillus campi TaxID=3106031 RepID=UPI002AFE92BC|nr:2-phosphosulfolactate phosphatase [Paenibacillus sp. SGZ-1014]
MFYDQMPFHIKLEWGQRGARAAAERGDIVIIVDVLSFSSTVVTAIQYGAEIYPYPPPINEQAKTYAQSIDAEIVWGRAETLKYGGHSLSPGSFTAMDKHKRFVMCSLNGAACTWMAADAHALLIGCMLNATAVAKAAQQLSVTSRCNITVVPCGEKWSDAMNNENTLRPSIEDYLGAGMIVSRLNGTLSPEAEVCKGAYEQAKDRIPQLLWESASARELRERGYEQDVVHCSQIDRMTIVPVLQAQKFMQLIL